LPRTKVVFYQEDDATVPLLEWFDRLPTRAQDKCRLKIERLEELGHELRRPEADYLRDGIYELRVSLQGVHYRMLYFFHGTTAAVLSHGTTKERRVPPHEIALTIRRKRLFEHDPTRHTHEAD
jgi:hypothetical protein